MPTFGERIMKSSAGLLARGTLARGEAPPVDARKLQRVLVIRTDDRVGNILLTTPLVRALREGLPQARIDWLLPDRRRLLVDGLFLADSLVPFNRRWPVRNPARAAALAWRLRNAEYDAVIDAAHYTVFSTTAAMLTRWTGAPVRIGHARGDAERYYTHAVPTPPEVRYDVAAKLGLLAPLGVAPRGIHLETSAGTSVEARERAGEILVQAAADAPLLVVNPGARKEDRRFPPERLGEIVKRLCAATGARALVVWGPGEEALAQAAVAAAGSAAQFAPPTDLHVLAALLRRAALLVTNDTGPMHLGVACGAPVLAIFTVADSERWGHPLPTFRVVDAAGDASDLVERAVSAGRGLVSAGRAPAPGAPRPASPAAPTESS